MRFTAEKDGKVMMWTDDKSCIPEKAVLQQMKQAGYKLKMDGKLYLPSAPSTKER